MKKKFKLYLPDKTVEIKAASATVDEGHLFVSFSDDEFDVSIFAPGRWQRIEYIGDVAGRKPGPKKKATPKDMEHG